MSSDDASKPKRPSGAEFKRRRRAAQEEYRRRAAEQGGEGTGDILQQYRDVSVPDEGAIGGIAYANRIAVLMLREIATDTLLDAPDRRRQMRDAIAVIGMTHSKALAEERIAQIEKKLGIGVRSEKNDTGETVVAAGGKTLRARGGARLGDALSRSLPEFSPEGERETDGN